MTARFCCIAQKIDTNTPSRAYDGNRQEKPKRGGVAYETMSEQHRCRRVLCGVWRWVAGLLCVAYEMCGRVVGGRPGLLRFILHKTVMEGVHMRVVVMKSPKLLGGLLRKLFRIEKMPKDM